MYKILEFCKTELKKYFRLMIGYLFLVLISSIMSNLMPYINGRFIDNLLKIGNLKVIWRFMAIVLCVVTVSFILGYFSNIILIKLQQRMTYDIYKKMIIHLESLPMMNINKFNPAELNQRLSTDSSTVANFTISVVQSFISKTLILVMYIIIIYRINKIYCVFIFGFGIVYFLTNIFLKQKVYNATYNLRKVQNEFYGKTQEQFDYIRFIKTQGLNGIFGKRLDKPFENSVKASINNQKISYFYSGLDTYFDIGIQICMIFFGGNEIINNRMSIGEFTVVSSYISMSMNVLRYYYDLSREVQVSLTSYHRLQEILKIKSEKRGNIKIKNIDKIKLKEFSIDINDNRIIDNFNYTFRKGNIYAVTGKNGAGKTTLLYSIMGMFNGEYKGDIFFNDENILNLDMEYMRKNIIGYSEQLPVIFDGTVEDNIFLFNNERNQSVVYKKIKLKKYLFNDGKNISGGEKLKISIERALIKNPSIILLDEPSSMLDDESIVQLIDILKTIQKDKIIIIVTHDEKIINIANNVVDYNL